MKLKYSYIFRSILSALLLMLFASHSNSQIILSEVMFDPIGNENYDEFIEIYNTSTTKTINLSGWQISDSLDADLIIAYEMGTLLKPQQYGIILDAGYFDNSRQYENLIPPEALILTIDDAALGKQGLSNSVAEPIILIAANGSIVAKYRYTLNNPPGYSDEKRNLLGDDSPENWANSKVLNGTPGFENSVRQFDYDIKLSLHTFPSQALPGQAITLTGTITNIGIKNASNIEVTFFEDVNFDSFLTANEQIGLPYFIYEVLKPANLCSVHTQIDSLPSGPHYCYGKAAFAFDQDNSNNLAATIVKVGFRARQVIINEIMYRPAAGQAEWIELYNPTNNQINLQYWQFSDANINTKITLADSVLPIAAKGYLIIAEDSTLYHNFPVIPGKVIIPAKGFPALNNNGDKIFLYDPIGTIIDQVNYEFSWGSQSGISLERKRDDRDSNDPSNWALAQNSAGGTPGFQNSISPIAFDLELTKIAYQPDNPFPGEEISISCTITNVGRSAISNCQISGFIDLNHDEIFQDDERIGQAFTIAEIIEPGKVAIATITYQPSYSGIYLFRATVLSENDVNTSNNACSTHLSIGFEKNALIINEIMYSPLPGQPEWIELFNPRNTAVDIRQWLVADADSSQTMVIAKNHFEIAPQAFMVLAADSSILSYYDLNNSPLLVIKKLPTLNNDMDKVFIFDANKNVIDKVSYLSRWGGDKGISLERINPNLASEDSSNWSSCVFMAQGGTPGRKNSIFVEVLPSEATLTISPDPFSPDGDGRDDVTIITYQLPFNLSQIHVRIFDIRGRQVRFLVNNQPSGTTSLIIWDGRDDQGHICRMGIYIIYLEAIHYQRGVVKSLKKSVVLAKQL